MRVSWLTGFLAGFVCLALIEVCAIAFFLRRLLGGHRRRSSSSSPSADRASVTFQPPNIFLQGEMWVAALPALAIKKDNIKIVALREKPSKDHWRRKETSDDCVEIYPSRSHARLEKDVLTLTSEDGCEKCIEMRGCKVLSVSGGKEMSRKWSKKYPIQLESLDQKLPLKIWLLYLETSWEKETWCQVLRAAANWTSEKETWYMTRKREFHEYCAQVDEAYPAFAKGVGSRSKRSVEDEKGAKIDKDVGPSLSKRQKLWRRITKKGSMRGNAVAYKEVTGTADLSTGVLLAKSSNRQDDLLETRLLSEGSLGYESAGSSSFRSNPERVFLEDTMSLPDSVKSIDYGVLQQDLTTPMLDQGGMCWNIICSRLFFDGYKSLRFQEACHRFIQKQFAKIVTPAYMGKINCTKFQLGSKPPIFHSMQVHAKHSDYIWSFDAVVEYCGGAQLTVETRLDVCDSVSQEYVVNQSLEPTLAGAAAADILRKGLETVEENADDSVVRAADTEAGVSGGEKALPSKRRWKAILARVADQVSLVPITMSMKLVSLKGTIRVQIKPPPTDRIWFGFTSMPTVELQPEPSIGDHKITTGPVIAFITNRIKMLIQESLVLPNCEGIWVPWMIADSDDWLPVTARPVPWSPLDTRDSLSREETQALKDASVRSIATTELSPGGKLGTIISGSEDSGELRELEKPLLCNVVSESEYGEPTLDASLTPSNARLRSVTSTDSGDAGNRSSRRSKMLSLGKRVTEKLDEKRRFMVDKVREEIEKYEQGAR